MPFATASVDVPRFTLRDADVIENIQLCAEHWRLTFRLNGFPPSVPGQFLQLLSGEDFQLSNQFIDWDENCPPPLADQSGAFLRRAFSIAGRVDFGKSSNLQVIHRVVGSGTDWLSNRRAGDTLNVLGPLGRGFVLPTDGSELLLVGGGVGIPPMIYLAQSLLGQKATAFCGAMTKDLFPLHVSNSDSLSVEPFHSLNVPTHITTDDGSLGRKGFVTEALADYLAAAGHRRFTIYTCGPEPMLKAVASLARQFELPCQVCVERTMACGMGTCQSCVIRIREPGAESSRFRLTCTDGPVFQAETVVW